jgi:preprotein translocase subunit YajC
MVSIVVVFYLFMIRPQTKKQKEEKKMRESLKKGDKVVTIGGVHAKVLSVEDLTVLLEVDEGVKVRYDKAAVRNVVDSEKNG